MIIYRNNQNPWLRLPFFRESFFLLRAAVWVQGFRGCYDGENEPHD